MHCTCVKGEGKGKSCHITCASMKSEQKVKHFTEPTNTNKRKQSSNNTQVCLHEFWNMYFWLCLVHRPCGPLGYFKKKTECSTSILFNHKSDSNILYLACILHCITYFVLRKSRCGHSLWFSCCVWDVGRTCCWLAMISSYFSTWQKNSCWGRVECEVMLNSGVPRNLLLTREETMEQVKQVTFQVFNNINHFVFSLLISKYLVMCHVHENQEITKKSWQEHGKRGGNNNFGSVCDEISTLLKWRFNTAEERLQF